MMDMVYEKFSAAAERNRRRRTQQRRVVVMWIDDSLSARHGQPGRICSKDITFPARA